MRKFSKINFLISCVRELNGATTSSAFSQSSKFYISRKSHKIHGFLSVLLLIFHTHTRIHRVDWPLTFGAFTLSWSMSTMAAASLKGKNGVPELVLFYHPTCFFSQKVLTYPSTWFYHLIYESLIRMLLSSYFSRWWWHSTKRRFHSKLASSTSWVANNSRKSFSRSTPGGKSLFSSMEVSSIFRTRERSLTTW